MRNSIIATAFLIFQTPIFADTTASALANIPMPDNADVSLLVVDPQTNTTLHSQHAEQFRQPASIQKLVTALAAELYLQDDFRFVTSLEKNKDDVVLRFSGDPKFTRTNLRVLVEELKRHTSVIPGNLYLNGSIFDHNEHAIGVPWDIKGVCYSAPSSSITMNGNCVYGKLEALNPNDTSQLTASASDHINIAAGNILIKNTPTDANYDCQLKLTADKNNGYEVDGCLLTHRLPVNFHLAIQNTTDYMTKVVYEELKRAGITIKGAVIRSDKAGGEVLATHSSPPLKEMIDEMVQDSDNLIADNLLKVMGHLYYEEPGSFENGAAAIKNILKTQADIDLSRAIIADGSGLSRNNRITATQMLAVVRHIFEKPRLGLAGTLPVSGESGTLQWRPSVRNAPLKGQIAAKTGAIYGVYNLAGRLKTQSGKTLFFVQMVTNYHPASKNRNIARKPLRLFEKSVYEALYNQY